MKQKTIIITSLNKPINIQEIFVIILNINVLIKITKKDIKNIQWNMKGIYLEVAESSGDFQWFTPAEIRGHAALPTAFRQFWDLEDIENV